jgi:hypothetical protein
MLKLQSSLGDSVSSRGGLIAMTTEYRWGHIVEYNAASFFDPLLDPIGIAT